MAETLESADLFAKTRECLDLFRALSDQDPDAHKTDQDLQATRKRFLKWCQSIGAHLQGPRSLDERFRDASRVRALVQECLDGVVDALVDIKNGQSASSQGGHQDHTPETGVPSAAIEERAWQHLFSNARIGSPIRHANAMIDSLFQITVAVRPRLSADRYVRAQQSKLAPDDEEAFRQGDLEYLKFKFPNLDPRLRDRVQSASMQRRKVLQYTQDRNEGFKLRTELEFGASEREAAKLDREIFNEIASRNDSPAASGYTESFISRADDVSQSVIFGRRSSLPASETSSMVSLALSYDGRRFGLPSFPAESENGLLTCPVCYLLLPLENERVWRSHILEDLRPYVCTFPDCTFDPGKSYSKRRAWFEHELTFHRRRWPCPLICGRSAFSTRQQLEIHLKKDHQKLVSAYALQTQQGMEIPVDAVDECPFCGTTMKSRKGIKSHVARHQAQIALLALSTMREYFEDDEEVSSDEAEDTETMAEPAHLAPQGHEGTCSKIAAAPASDVAGSQASSSAQTSTPNEHPTAEPLDDKSRQDMKIPLLGGIRRDDENAPSARRKVRPLQNIFGLRRMWFLMPDLTYHFHSPFEGSLPLGQIIRDPLKIDSGCIPVRELDRYRARILYSFNETEDRDWELELTHSSASSIPILQATRGGIEVNIALRGTRITSFVFVPEHEMIMDMLARPSVLEATAWKAPSRRLTFRSRRLYMVTGLRVVDDLELCKESRDTRFSAHAEGFISRVGAKATVDRHIGQSNRFRARGRVILAYSLTKIEQSWQGNLILTRHDQGDIV